MACQSIEDLKALAQWDGAFGRSRRILLQEISRMIAFPLKGCKLADLFKGQYPLQS